MNQFNWTYLADNGKQHQINLMHGATSGHLLVHCNTTIVIIDFSVLQTSSYSFFIEEELCELTIERKGDQFYYSFEVDREADTPLNKERKKRDKKYLFQSLFFLGGILLLVSIIIVALTYFQNPDNQVGLKEKLQFEGTETSARVVIDPQIKGQGPSYVYFADGRSYTGKTALVAPEKQNIVLENGMPLENGDEFLVTYLEGSPKKSQIDFNQPTLETLEKYYSRALRQYLLLFPEVSPERAQCFIEVAFELKSIDGLANFYFSNTVPTVNSRHNKESFLRLIRDLPFEQLSTKKCGIL